MGICGSVQKRERKSTTHDIVTTSKPSPNPNSVITGIKNKTIIKEINDIKGSTVQIDNCSNTSIIIMDFSAQVTIERCSDCVIFIAPCKSS
jgi:hypothetical protein